MLAEPIACVVNSHEFLNIDSDSTVAIFGSGFIGSMHIELAKLKGAKKIIMIEVINQESRNAKTGIIQIRSN